MKTSVMLASASKTSDKVLLFDGQGVTKVAIDEAPRTAKVAVDFSDKELISYNFDVSKDLSSEEMQETIEIKMFQEAGLNPMLSYKIVHNLSESRVDTSKYNVQAYAIATNAIERESTKYTDKLGFIDLILPTTALPGALYRTSLLESRNDVFVYFVKSAAFLSIYVDAKLVYGKVIDVGFGKLYDVFLKSTGEKMGFDDFVSMMIKKGVKKDNYDFEDKRFAIDFTNIINNAILKINNVLDYATRMFMIESYSRVFVGSKYGLIPGITELFNEATQVEAKDYIFYTKFFTNRDDYIDQRENLLLLELDLIEQKSDDVSSFNVSLNRRASSFMKRKSGLFIFFMANIVFLAFIVPFAIYANAWYYNILFNKKVQELKLSQTEFERFKHKERELRMEKGRLEGKLERATATYKKNRDLLDNLRNKRVNKVRVILFINNVFSIMSKFNVKIVNLIYKNKAATLFLEGKSQEDITALTKALVANGYTVHLESIELSRRIYKGTIKVEVK